ncbi:hypothetical protein H4582DRAFT_2016582 [Lactarius indigo]|nr:hypothetical protein H4582DRAFT_2016582 [Lactarius indigo]
MLVLTMITVAATIGIRVFINTDPIRDKNRLATIINVFQEITLISSLLTNILGTSVISLKAWRYRRWIVTDLQRVVNLRTKTERVLALLVESGVFYIFSGVRMVISLLKKSMLVASSFIRIPGSHIMLGNVYSQAAVHMAVSVLSKFRVGTNKMSGNVPSDCRRARQPRSVNGQDSVQSNPPSGHHRLTTSLLPLRSQSDRFSPSQVHTHDQPPICECAGFASYAGFSRPIVVIELPVLRFKHGV